MQEYLSAIQDRENPTYPVVDIQSADGRNLGIRQVEVVALQISN